MSCGHIDREVKSNNNNNNNYKRLFSACRKRIIFFSKHVLLIVLNRDSSFPHSLTPKIAYCFQRIYFYRSLSVDMAVISKNLKIYFSCEAHIRHLLNGVFTFDCDEEKKF